MSRLLSVVLLLFSCITVFAQIDAIVIDKQAKQQNPTLRFQGLSGDSALSDRVRQTLIHCGWFQVVRSGDADYLVSGTGNANSVSLRIANGADREIATVSARGADVYDTAHAGVDAVLHELFQIPGLCRSKIVFTAQAGHGKKELMICDFDGQRPTRITQNATLSMDPLWSPDGRYVIYSYIGRSFTNLVQYDTTNGLSRMIAKYRGLNAGGAISPADKNTLALVLDKDNQVDLYTRGIEGGELRRLTKDSAVEASPCWSPDGKQICFVSDATGRPLLYIANAASSARPEPIRGIAGSERVAPDWSTDGKIAYSAKIGRDYTVAVVDLKAGKPVMEQIGMPGQPPVTGEGPSWAPDNRHVVVEDKGGIYVVDTWLGKKRPLFSGSTKTGQPDWSPLFR